jgi:Na+/H+ antiporter NhaD/arsenite permease-like protein
MNQRIRWVLAAVLVAVAVVLALPGAGAQTGKAGGRALVGAVKDEQDQPVSDARVLLMQGGSTVAQAETQPDGHYTLLVPEGTAGALTLRIERTHFRTAELTVDAGAIRDLPPGQALLMQSVTLKRQIGPAFWIASLTFLLVLALIAYSGFHNTLAALVGTAIIFAVSYLGTLLDSRLFVLDFGLSLRYIDWNVIFLIMGMMIFIAVVEKTGIFQWMALAAYRVSGGHTWLLLTILMLVTGVASAFLDNVTTMLLMTPITIQIALAMGINPLAFLMPEVMASNISGISTLIGTPTNILIGSYGHISFDAFLKNLTPGVLLALVGLIVYSEIVYREDLASRGKVSEILMEKLSERARIEEPGHLVKAAIVGAGMLVLFLFGEKIELLPSVTALMGATALLVWIKPDIEEMIEAVDWTTLVFFIALFIDVGAVQEVGLMSLIAREIGRVVGSHLILAMLAVIWTSSILSTVIANIPFTAAMLPVVGYLTVTVPGAQNKALFYSLSVGSAMGGNGSLIGASANMVTAGIAERAGYPITYKYFLKKGFPALVITTGLATLWLLFRFLVLG